MPSVVRIAPGRYPLTMKSFSFLLALLALTVLLPLDSRVFAASITDGLVAHWKLDETTSGGTGSVLDSSGGANHGTPSGATGVNNKPQPSSSVPDVSFI